MSFDSEDDRTLAAEFLSGDEAAASRLLRKCHDLLVPVADRWLREKHLDARKHCDAEDLVQGFLAGKLLPTASRETLFRPVADGTKPLQPLLIASLHNFSESFVRSLLESKLRKSTPGKQSVQITSLAMGSDADSFDPPQAPDEDGPTIMDRLHDWSRAIRDTWDRGGNGQPYLPALLLSVRIDLANHLKRDKKLSDCLREGQSLRDLVEAALPWTSEDLDLKLERAGPKLVAIWDAFCSHSDGLTQRTDVEILVAYVGVSKDRWHQWTCRAKAKVRERVGPDRAKDIERLFIMKRIKTGGDA